MLPKIVVVVGPTASGKTSFAVRLAKKIGGEIVSADSRLLYRGMDIGTAKPGLEERGGIPHHLIDIVRPSGMLTLSGYQRRAFRAIGGILRRGKTPILVGGTGLYVRAVVENLRIPEVPPDPKYRAYLEKKGAAWILARLAKLDPEYAARIGPNPRYASRALEVIRATGKPFGRQQGAGKRKFDALLIGLYPGKPELERRIGLRVRQMAESGLLDEARSLHRRYGEKKSGALWTAIGYRELLGVLRGEKDLEEALKEIVTSTRQYAKRQMTWFRGVKGIEWFPRPDAALRKSIIWLKQGK